MSDSFWPYGLWSPPGSSVHGILQVRILEWVIIPFSRGSSQSRDQTQVSSITGRFFTVWAIRETPSLYIDEFKTRRLSNSTENFPLRTLPTKLIDHLNKVTDHLNSKKGKWMVGKFPKDSWRGFIVANDFLILFSRILPSENTRTC